jgi:ribonucleoside-diphosphate reductase beta chain
MSKLLEGNQVGVNQIIGAEHQYPLELYKKGIENNWNPREVIMGQDILDWKMSVTDDEKLIVKRALGFFSAGESLVNNNIFLSEYRYIIDGSCRQYMVRKAQEEAIHNETVSVCVECFGLTQKEVAEAYLSVPSVKNKTDFLMRNTYDVMENRDFDITSIKGKQDFVKNLFCFYVICEGTFFWSNFVMLLAVCKRGVLNGLKSQLHYTLRDEGNHLSFGIWVINQIKNDYPEIWTKEFIELLSNLMREAVALEISYAEDALPNPMLGLNSSMFVDFMQYIGNIRLNSIGMESLFSSNINPFSWIEEIIETPVMTAFFEQREKSYRASSALEGELDDF